MHGTIFDPINSADLCKTFPQALNNISDFSCSDPAAGASDDWYKGVLGSRFAYTTELRDTGFYGFVLPPDQIIPSGEEMWAAFEVVIAKMLSL